MGTERTDRIRTSIRRIITRSQPTEQFYCPHRRLPHCVLSMPRYSLRILLVEDHPFQLLATQCLLNSFGFDQLTAVENAEQAIRTMSQSEHPFDLMLCDQCLPDLPGLELVEIASRRRFITSAILLSGLPTPELMSLTKQASQRSLPLLGYLSKPLNKDELEKLIGLTFTPPT